MEDSLENQEVDFGQKKMENSLEAPEVNAPSVKTSTPLFPSDDPIWKRKKYKVISTVTSTSINNFNPNTSNTSNWTTEMGVSL